MVVVVILLVVQIMQPPRRRVAYPLLHTQRLERKGSPVVRNTHQSAAPLRTGSSPAYRTWGPARGWAVRVACELVRHGGGHDRLDTLAERARAHRRTHRGTHCRGRAGRRGRVAGQLLQVVADGGYDELYEG